MRSEDTYVKEILDLTRAWSTKIAFLGRAVGMFSSNVDGLTRVKGVAAFPRIAGCVISERTRSWTVASRSMGREREDRGKKDREQDDAKSHGGKEKTVFLEISEL